MKLQHEYNWKNGKIFFYLSILFIIITIGFLFFEIRTITQNKYHVLNSTLFDLMAMIFAFLALGMIFFTKFFKIGSLNDITYR